MHRNLVRRQPETLNVRIDPLWTIGRMLRGRMEGAMNSRGFALYSNPTPIHKADGSDASGRHFLPRLLTCIGIAVVAALSAPLTGFAQ
jgi:hypothetical protein